MIPHWDGLIAHETIDGKFKIVNFTLIIYL